VPGLEFAALAIKSIWDAAGGEIPPIVVAVGVTEVG